MKLLIMKFYPASYYFIPLSKPAPGGGGHKINAVCGETEDYMHF
jgi:hypothetical protein